MTHYLQKNLAAICQRHGLNLEDLLAEFGADEPMGLKLQDLHAIAERYGVDTQGLLFSHIARTEELEGRLSRIRLLIIDVDGVMTDGGMYFTEAGDEFKKFNTKDGMAIIHLTRSGFQVAILSSGFKGAAVKRRADMLGIQFCYVGRSPKLGILEQHMETLGIGFENVAIIGDDINDLPIMRRVGLAACPRDAVPAVKAAAHLVLNKRGGRGCVRELIDDYLLEQPIG